MKVTFISNACCIYEANRMRILTDPWLVDGAFEGAWFHAPALKTKPRDLIDVDALFISHIHPDHYDLKTLSAFQRDIPIFILDAYPGFLKKSLEHLGFTKVIAIPPEKPYEFGPFELTLFSPFAKHAHHEAEIVECQLIGHVHHIHEDAVDSLAVARVVGKRGGEAFVSAR